jgi:hypothetical protein
MTNRFLAAVAAITLTATACSGGGQNSPVPRVQSTPDLPVPVSFSVRVPAPQASPSSGDKRPASISPDVQSINFILTDSRGVHLTTPQSTVVALIANGPNCTADTAPADGSYTCTSTSTAPTGSAVFTVQTSTGPTGNGLILDAGTVGATIVGGVNAVNITLGGVIATMAFSAVGTCINGAACTTSVAVNPKDAAGDTIVGPGVFQYIVSGSGNSRVYANDQIALACDAGLSTQKVGGTAATSPITSPITNDLVQVVYDGSTQFGGLANTGVLHCTATTTSGHVETFTANLSAGTGTVNWGVN